MEFERDSLEALFSLRGRVAMVTGASSGLGLECARAVAIGGAKVALVARRRERLERLANELTGLGVQTLCITADLTVTAELDRAVAVAAAELGEIDVLVNAAGISAGGAAEKVSQQDWDAVFAINTTAPMMLTQRVARRLIEHGQPGRIINVSSIYASHASPYKRPLNAYRMVAYAASKAALENMTRQLAIEWAQYGINVNAVAPGMVPTELNQQALAMPGIRERSESFTPQGRLGRPEEIRGAVIFLASAASSYVTGAVLTVDGGYGAW
jgi:NAD(P)-dependent dehydrogenase (short-subunit alcohol dehydrogenase family)